MGPQTRDPPRAGRALPALRCTTDAAWAV